MKRRSAKGTRAGVIGAWIAAGMMLAFGGVTFAVWATVVRMPGASYTGPFAPLTEDERAIRTELQAHVEGFATDIAERRVGLGDTLTRAADRVRGGFERAGYQVRAEDVVVDDARVANLEATIVGGARGDEIVIVGAHYDSAEGTPGADDNASGVAALLVIAKRLAGSRPSRTIRFVAFANEEPPFFQTDRMGSVVYAEGCKRRGDRVVAMLSLETLGFYSDEPGSQKYPAPFSLFYPSAGDFIGFVGETSSRALVRSSVGAFRASTRFPSEGVAAPTSLPGVGWSDHWSFTRVGYPAVMVTDTALFRNTAYHTAKDVPGRLAYGPFARVVLGVSRVVEELARRDDG